MRERAPKILRGPVPRNKEDDQVVYVDSDSAPRIIFSGEDLLLEDLPIGTRIIYPKPPIEGLANPGAAIRYALNHPLGSDPLGQTDNKEPVNINRRAVESDLVIYVNINLVPMDGGHKSVAVGLCDYESLRPHHEPETIRASDSYMDPKKSALNTKVV